MTTRATTTAAGPSSPAPSLGSDSARWAYEHGSGGFRSEPGEGLADNAVVGADGEVHVIPLAEFERDFPPARAGMECPLDLASGGSLDLANPDPRSIYLTDVGLGLARTVRYRGQVGYYSVAQHAVFMADVLQARGADPLLVLAALHHDDAEAYTGDLHGPLKHGPAFPELGAIWAELETRLDQAIVPGLGLPFEPHLLHDPLVKQADTWARLFEKSKLFPEREWPAEAAPWDLSEGDAWWRGCLPEDDALALWLGRHGDLIGWPS